MQATSNRLAPARPSRTRRVGRAVLLLALGLMVPLAIAYGLQRRKQPLELAALRQGETFFDDQGRLVRYRLRGATQPGPTVVLLSGFGASLEQWDLQQQRLSAFAPVLTYDRGGYALSDRGLAEDADAQADELSRLAAMNRLPLPLVVVSYSSSALIARTFARRHPALLAGLVFLDPTTPEEILAQPWREKYGRRALYERTPLLLALKTSVGLNVIPAAQREATKLPEQKRADRIVRLSSHWWAAYREGSCVARSAEQARLDWSKLHVPIAVLSLADEHGSPGTQERYRRHRALATDSGATFQNPPGWRHDQITSDVAFMPVLVDIVNSVIRLSPTHQ